MSKIVTTEVNERRHRVTIDRHELKRIVVDAVLQQMGRTYCPKTMEVKVEFEDETEGSPSYKVGTGCIVYVVEDLDVAPPAAA